MGTFATAGVEARPDHHCLVGQGTPNVFQRYVSDWPFLLAPVHG